MFETVDNLKAIYLTLPPGILYFNIASVYSIFLYTNEIHVVGPLELRSEGPVYFCVVERN